MSIVGNLWRPHDFTGRRLTAADFAREARYLRDGARRVNRFLHGRVVARGPEASPHPCGVQVGAGMAIDCVGNELVAPSAMRDGIACKARTQVAATLHKEAEVRSVPSPSTDTLALSIREAAELMIREVNPSRGCRRMGHGTSGCGDAHPIGLAVLTAGREGRSLRHARGACSHARTGAR